MSSHYDYHQPVMCQEAMEALKIKPSGIYLDLTFGGGGHACALLEQLGPEGSLWAFDQDPDALKQANQLKDSRFHFIQANFRYCSRFLHFFGITKVDGILVDLGVSSHQIDTPERGFSTRFKGPLDMRMSCQGKRTAATLIKEYERKKLVDLFRRYGDLHNAHKLVACLRDGDRIPTTTQELMSTITPLLPKQRSYQYAAKVFQALRIEVNDELGALRSLLEQLPLLLKPGGQVVFLTYHAGEDRLVKRFLRSGNFLGQAKKDPFGTLLRPLEPCQSKPLKPTLNEIVKNNRARSARLRSAIVPLKTL